MNKKILALALAIALPGCTGVPSARYYDQSDQMIVSSAQHWHVIAEDVAAHLKPSVGKRVQLLGSAGHSQFELAFDDFLATAITERGVGVYHWRSHAPSPWDAEVKFNVRTIYHDRAPIAHPGSLTLLGAATGTLVWAATTTDTVAAAAAPGIGAGLGAATEILNGALPPSPNREIIVNASVSRGGVDIARFSQVYYIAAGDSALYAQPSPPPLPLPPPAPKPSPNIILNLDTLGNYPDSARVTTTPF